MSNAISSANTEEIATAANALRDLESEATRLNAVTEELMKTYEITDDEANYSYRIH